METDEISLKGATALPGIRSRQCGEATGRAYRSPGITLRSWATDISRQVLTCVAATAVCAALAVPALADPIVEEDGGYAGYDFGDAAVGWTQATGFTNVTVSADLAQTGDIDQATDQTYSSIGPLVAYITTSIGPGTTPADVVASSTQSLGVYDSGYVTLLSGLTLGPGTYYLVIQTPLDTYVDYSNASYTIGTGVTGVTSEVGQTGLLFEPSDTFSPYGGRGEGNFQVTIDGTPSATPVPEPKTLSLFGLGLAAIVAARRRA